MQQSHRPHVEIRRVLPKGEFQASGQVINITNITIVEQLIILQYDATFECLTVRDLTDFGTLPDCMPLKLFT